MPVAVNRDRPTEGWRRVLAGVVLPLVAVAAGGLTLAVTAGSLPDPLATHWDFGGEPDGATNRVSFVAVVGIVVIGLGVTIAVIARRRRVRCGQLAAPMALAAFLQWLASGILVTTLRANADVTIWQDADSLPILVALAVVLVAVGAAALTATLVQPLGEDPTRTPVADATVGAHHPRERPAWFTRVRTRWPLWLALPIVTLGVVALGSASPVIGALLLASAVMVAAFAAVEVMVDHQGLTVRYGPLGWPRTRIPIEDIDRAEVVEVQPLRHGGWGYRGSLRLFGRAAVILRAGEALSLRLRNGRRFTVTVDDAAGAAGAVNDLAAASGRTR